MAKPALGKGLGALLGGNPIAKPPQAPAPVPTKIPATSSEPDSRETVQRVRLDQVHASPFQPRKEFAPEALRELADSIKEQGIIQPLIVRSSGGKLELIAGERRWRAAQLAGVANVPVIVRQADDRAVLELALIENLQRENLNPIEEAQGYSQLISQFNLQQEQVAAKVGKSRPAVANALRLLRLPEKIQADLRENRLSVGHAKVLLGLVGEQRQQQIAERIIREGLNVRQTEALIATLNGRENGTAPKPASKIVPIPDTHVASLENKVRERLKTKVQLRYAQGKGALEISFSSDAELDGILEALGIEPD